MDTCKHVGGVLKQPSSFSAQSPPSPRAFVDADLSQLREQIKKIMIPKLIRVFELKLAAQQASMPPSRLLGSRPDAPKIDEILAELSSLQEDLKVLQLWTESCCKQVNKALEEIAGYQVQGDAT
jgi:hypothetical protein